MTLPRGWAIASIGNLVVDRVRQGEPTTRAVAYIDIGSIDRERKTIGETQKVTSSTAPTRARQWVSAGDVLVSMTRPNLNAVALVPEALDGAVASTGFDVLRPLAVVPEWIYYRVRSQAFVQDVCADVQGVVYPAIRPADVRRHELPIPPGAEQRRIVEALESHLSRLDSAVASLEAAHSKLKAYRGSVLKAAVEGRLVPTEAELARKEGRSYEAADVLLERILKERRRRWEDAELARLKATGKTPRDGKWKVGYEEPAAADAAQLPSLPAGWCWATVEQLASDVPRSIQSGPFGSNLLHSEFTDHGKLVIGIDNVQDGYFSMGEEHRISDEKFAALEHYRARRGDVLVTVMATIGRTCVVPDDLEPAIVTKHVYRITPDQSIVTPRYLHLALWGGPVVREQMFGRVIGQTRPGLNGGILRRLAIPLPTLAEQRRIVDTVERLLSFRDHAYGQIEHSSSRVSRLRQSILKSAFEGNLVDQDPFDESADALLAIVRAEPTATTAGRTKEKRARKLRAAS